MAEVSAVLPAYTFLGGNAARLRWRSLVSGELIDATPLSSEVVVIVEEIRLQTDTARVNLRTRPQLSGGGIPGNDPGPELSPAWEANDQAIVLQVPGLSDLRIPGPAYPGNASEDSTEPYVWAVASVEYAGGLSQWLSDLNALSDPAITLTLTDEPAPPPPGELAGITRAAIGVRGDLGAHVLLAGVVRAAVRTRGALRAAARLAGVARARIRARGALAASTRLAGVARAAIRTRGGLLGPVRMAGTLRAATRARGTLRTNYPAGAVFTADGNTLDEICWRRYGREDAVPDVLAANPGLADADPVLPAGVLLVLPELPDARRALPAERLWGVAPPWVVLPERAVRAVVLGGVFRAAIRTLG